MFGLFGECFEGFGQCFRESVWVLGNTFEVLRKKGGTLEIFKNFFKNAAAIFKILISYSITPKGIFCDRKRNMIFGLL